MTYAPKPLSLDPKSINGISEKVLTSHYENNYVGAVRRLNAMGAQLARRLIGSAKAEIDMPITGIKPMPLHALWPVAVTATVLAGRARDRLGI